ncbi:hypothetical protein GLOIN_2v1706311 [Rhizophagus irregularis DAOM 181602=DAOM 197198]|uniref:Uncharacterized protein n=1 Tax=Rhizophagus irregularis (strain DAOM 181602 / DAOM 197198 / MUCL 43194) TaxID=747089 RepID=A0A2P4P720_RHIID|nr:hypothetical protein GLOIN_2v1706311 [Rhizophagus irregularis DAOM 181602=DAOM 197198]POG61147.1 hypothetical protein GLOIN_2v1706311 [Rhizophagus irregularis DAOM 181602=DAOM 197198]|eukprot:XP_025168013.1 hypothetical protein GLOIN_2v1706311 [Rhizophagus irregularis DAOM 181602=DAOM 197198]
MASSKKPLKRRSVTQDREFVINHSKIEYSLDTVSENNWQLFMWLASLETVENYICLFILVWDTIPVRNSAQFSKELREETDNLIQIIKELNISEENDKNYSKMLDDYKEKELQQAPLNNKMKDENQEIILSENKSLENQIVGLADNNSQIGNSTILEDELQGAQNIQELLKSENENLKAQVEDLINESSKQVALDNLTNLSLNDDGLYNSRKLIQDIRDLQDMLSDFTMVQGSDYKIINDEANALLRVLKCEVKCPSSRASLVLGFLLQRIAIIKILEEVEKYLTAMSRGTGSQGMALEGDIANTTETLINQTILFEKSRKGEDDITKITPVKIRQDVYSALRCRGFPSDHSLITTTASKLLYKMNRYRQVVDEETKSEMDDLAVQITHKVINIFYFGFKTQASVPTYKFFDAGQALEPHLMQGAFGNNESKKLEVEVCGFPCIGIFTGDKSSDRIFIKAQIITRSKRL